jgi:hypothetical protein
MRLITTLFLLTSCGAGTGTTTTTSNERKVTGRCTLPNISRSIDEEILPYVTEFSEDALEYKAACFYTGSIVFAPRLEEPVIGYCLPPFKVVLSREYWDKASEDTRRTLVYHELGHCSLNSEHTDEDSFHIMNPVLLSDWDIFGRWKYLVRKLFEGDN